MAVPHRNLHFNFPLFMYNSNFQKFCPGSFTGLHCLTQPELPSPRAPHCLLRPCPSCFFSLRDPYPRIRVSMLHKTNAHSIDRLARKHRFQGPVYKSFFTRARISDKQLAAASVYSVEFIIVLGGALQSNQNDNNSQKLQRVVWKD